MKQLGSSDFLTPFDKKYKRNLKSSKSIEKSPRMVTKAPQNFIFSKYINYFNKAKSHKQETQDRNGNLQFIERHK